MTGFLASPQHLHDVLVGGGGAHGRVDDEQHGVGQVDGDFGLVGDGAWMPRASGSQPPVSTTVKLRPFHSA